MKDRAPKPLTPAVLHILMALAGGELHGYAIMKQVEQDTGGAMKMGPGTLYGSISRMMKDALIAEGETRSDPEMDDARRVYYRLTALGEQALSDELGRYRAVLAAAARKKSLRPGTHGG
ncbi:MAG: PadR family transcriptional regulator [Hyphomonas sp.]